MKMVLMILLILGITTMATANSSQKNVFILAGQSNMVGVHSSSPAENSPDPSRIFRLTSGLTWEVAQDPLHADINGGSNGVGSGMSFANAVKDRVAPVGLVPCAVGASTIEQWGRGTSYYNNMVTRAKAAQQSGGQLKALFWYQGESNTGDDVVNNYKYNLETLIKNVREDLSSPSLPVIVVAIASGGPGANPNNVETIRNAQKSVQLANVAYVDAKGLELQSDQLHLTTNAQVNLGRMLAKQYLDKFH